MVGSENFVPLGYDLGSLVGGAVDYLDRNSGLFGWYTDLTRVGEISGFVASVHGIFIAQTIAFRDRADIDAVVGQASRAGFMFGWSRFDEKLLNALFSKLGDADIEIREVRTGQQLQWVIPRLTLDVLRKLVAAAPKGDRRKDHKAYSTAVDIWLTRLLDAPWYILNHDLGPVTDGEALQHYIQVGDAAGLRPNYYFDPSFYAQEAGLSTHKGALLDYAAAKEALRATSLHFDGAWYAEHREIQPGTTPLRSFLANRKTQSPNAWFDNSGYLKRYPDLTSVPDPYEHFVRFGLAEGRVGSDVFDAGSYTALHNLTAADGNPFEHFLMRKHLGLPDPEAQQAEQPVIDATEPPPEVEALLLEVDAGEAVAEAGDRPAQSSDEADLSVADASDAHAPNLLAGRPAVDIPWEDPAAAAAILVECGLFDADYYLMNNQDVVHAGIDAGLHFASTGIMEGRNPNPYFDAVWYAKKYFKFPPAEGCLRHYIESGEAQGFKPHPVFDPAWYGQTYGVPLGGGATLSHYLLNRRDNTVSPNAYFSIEDYLDRYPDIAGASIDGFEHWYNWGIQENRKASELFDAEFVWRRYLNNDRGKNAFTVFMDIGLDMGWEGALGEGTATLHREIKNNCNAGPLFEEQVLPPANAGAPRAKIMAFYLTQFHPIAENDAWWGAGFTEWRNIPRGLPRFEGHYQPRIPRDLGFYELNGTDVMRKQVDLAKSMGIHGFSFYYYNFNGHRLLEKPLDAFVEDEEIDFPFSLIWANENWTRRWDGMEKDVLIGQDYRDEDRDALIDDLARYMKHKNYLRLDGRPLLGIYRADIIPDCKETIEKWRAVFRERHDIDPFITMAQTFNCNDPTPFGFDAAFEFPPHKLGSTLRDINSELSFYDPNFTGSVRSYDEAVALSLANNEGDFPLIRTAFPMWDNDARKQGSGMVFQGATPAKFERWLDGIIDHATESPVGADPIVFINAWNEWCEGAYLEPDCHFGYAYLNAVARAAHKSAAPSAKEKILLVGHDAFQAGAQQLLLNIGQRFKRVFGSEVSFILMGDGDLLPAYREVGETYVVYHGATMWDDLNAHLLTLRDRGYTTALTNSIFSGSSVACLSGHGLRVVSLVHELPAIITENYGEDRYEAIRANSDVVIFPNKFVHAETASAFGEPEGTTVIRAQGSYKAIQRRPNAASRIRAQLGLLPTDRIVINVGHGDLRKGIDLFAMTADIVSHRRDDVHFVWVGSQHPGVISWLRRDVERLGHNRMHFVPFTDDIASYLSAADLFFLTSREDPFPTVVLEALSCGLPVASFDWGGGYVELLGDQNLGFVVPYLDVTSAAIKICEALDDPRQSSVRRQNYRRDHVAKSYDMVEYCGDLGQHLFPSRKRISVIVPNYNYARYMGERLESIFNQSYPVFEIIVLDDASKDDSVAAIEAAVAKSDRIIRLEVNKDNSGNVFRQWQKGLSLARGDYIWIAEADDLSDPTFLARMVAQMETAGDSKLAYCDSTAIDEAGDVMYKSYKGYYSAQGDTGLEQDGTFDAKEFLRRFLGSRNLILNVSAVLWDAKHLRDTFASLGDAAFRFTCAGDWRVYVEACRTAGKVHYIADCLNLHRRHSTSVTHALEKPEHFGEIKNVHDLVRSLFPKDVDLHGAIDAVQDELLTEWNLPG